MTSLCDATLGTSSHFFELRFTLLEMGGSSGFLQLELSFLEAVASSFFFKVSVKLWLLSSVVSVVEGSGLFKSSNCLLLLWCFIFFLGCLWLASALVVFCGCGCMVSYFLLLFVLLVAFGFRKCAIWCTHHCTFRMAEARLALGLEVWSAATGWACASAAFAAIGA